jgi:uncharacterized membrane protein YccC
MNAIRYALTLGLVYGVYSETGWWTAITIGLLVVANEVSAAAHE